MVAGRPSGAMGNGRCLPGQQLAATSERNLLAIAGQDGDRVSICSCTCYGRSGGRSTTPNGGREGGSGACAEGSGEGARSCARAWQCVGQLLGCREVREEYDEENFYDEETQSISNYTRFAVKRASF